MPESIRRFLCARYCTVAFIYTPCDRGQRYCPGDCACAARQSSRREANRRYARTTEGRLKSAERSQRYRDRQCVTDHGSLADCPRGVLDASATNAVAKTSANDLPPIAKADSGEAIGSISAELEAKILRYYHVEKWRVGTIARQLQAHHGTV
jgi:hypothetical protein